MTIDATLLASAFAAGGSPVWAGIIQGIIQLLKMVPQIASRLNGREKLACFGLALIVVLLAFWSALTVTPPTMTFDPLGVLTMLLSWFAIARLAMAAYDDFVAKAPATTTMRARATTAVTPSTAHPSHSVLSLKGWKQSAG